MLEILEEKTVDKEIKENISFAFNSTQILLHVINNVSDFLSFTTRKLYLHIETVKIDDLLNNFLEVIKFQAQQKQLEFIKKISPNSNNSRIRVDKIRFQEILFNLLNNAIKFTEKGYISLEIDFAGDKKHLLFKIADSGPGMNSDQISVIANSMQYFHPGHQNQSQILGLGLFISQNLLKLMFDGESIRIKSYLNKGSIFSFVIPFDNSNQDFNDTIEENKGLVMIEGYKTKITKTLSDKMISLQHDENKISSLPAKKNKKRKILIVDDDPMNLYIHQKYVESFGLPYEIATNGEQAVEKIKDSIHSKNAIDMILMDCNMPIMNGFDAANKIQHILKYNSKGKIPIIALTANSLLFEEKNILNYYGMKAWLEKPVSKALLKKVIEDNLNFKI